VARNRYFNQYTQVASEQTLVEDLIIESIKIYGHDVYYLPRTHVNLDLLYKEDASVLFDDALQLEVYLKTYDGYLGQNDFISKFGLQVDESLTFTVSQKRFKQILQSMIMTEYNYNIKLEDGNLLVTEGSYDYSTMIRPREGDLIWFPMTKDLFEVKFVEPIEVLFQLGKLYTYELRCDKYEYSSEKLDTDVAEIDQIETDYSLSTDNMPRLLNEDGDKLLNENGTMLLEEGEHIEERDDSGQNEYLQTKIEDEDVVDFSETNPFSSVRAF
jgi:hypothetical protein